MHFSIAVVLPDGTDADTPIEEVEKAVARAMAPYSENLIVDPWMSEVCQLAQLREYLAGKLGRPATDEEVRQSAIGWDGGLESPEPAWEGGRLYVWRDSNPDGNWDWYELGGRWHGLVDAMDAAGESGDLAKGWDIAGEAASRDVGRVGDYSPERMRSAFHGFLDASGRWVDGYVLTRSFDEGVVGPAMAAEFAGLAAASPDRLFAVVDFHS